MGLLFPEVPIDKHGKTQDRYIWGPSNKRIHEGPNLWQSWTVCLAVIEISSHKLPGKPLECRIQEGNRRATTNLGHKFQTALSAVTLELFSKELWRFKGKQGKHFHQDIHIMKECYQGWKDVNFLANNCWYSKQDTVATKHRRKSLKWPFIHE